MCRRLIIIGLLTCISLSVGAQISSVIEVSAGGGWSTLGYPVQIPSQPDVYGSNNGSWGLQTHVGYALFFTRNVGVGVGANFAHVGSNTTLGGTARWNDKQDTEGQNYSHLINIHSLNDKQDVWYLEIPLTFYVLLPLSMDVSLNLEVGAKYGMPLVSSASYTANIEHQGEYDQFGLLLYDIPKHGYYSDPEISESYTLSIAQHQVSAFLKAGIEYKFSSKTRLFANAYADFGCIDILPKENGALGFGYASSKPIQVGLELGLRFVFNHRRKYPCHCIDN